MVFALPRQLASLTLQHKKAIYDLVFRTSAETLLEVARDPKHLGAETGFFSVLHSWNQKLELHPHVHCVVPSRWTFCRSLALDQTTLRFLSSCQGASRVFRGRLNFHGDLKLFAQPKIFAAWLRPLFRKDWVVYCKRPFGGPEHVLRYLGRYTHRVAIPTTD